MNPDILKYLEDINLSIQAIEDHIRNVLTLREYESDLKTIDAVKKIGNYRRSSFQS